MNSIITKIIIFFISVFIILMVGSQIYYVVSENEETYRAISYTTKQTIDFDGVFVRNETILPYSGGGVLNYINSDGSKIASNSIVAQVVTDEEQIDIINNIANLEQQSALIDRATNPGTIDAAQPEFISKQIDEKYNLLLKYSTLDDNEKISAIKLELLTLMNIYNLSTQTEDKSTFVQKKNDINTKIAELKSQLKQPLDLIKTTEPGYFVSFADGYEEILNFDTIKSITPEEIIKITNSNISKNPSAVGKIYDGCTWKIVGNVKAENDYLKNTNIKIKINGDDYEISAYVEDMKHINDDNYIIIISTDILSDELAIERVGEVQILTNSYTGVKVPRKAITFKDDVRGVYVSFGKKKVFKKLDVIYEGDDYVLSNDDATNEYVLIHDQLVFEEVK